MSNSACWICQSSKFQIFFKFLDYSAMYKFCINSEFENKECKLLCAQCASTIQQFNNFKKKCLQSETVWQHLYNSQNHDIQNESDNIRDITLVKHESLDTKLELDTRTESRNGHQGDSEVDNEPLDEWLDTSPKPAQKRSKYSFEGICDKCNVVFSRKHQLMKHIQSCGQESDILNKKKLKISKTKVLALFCGLCETTAEDAKSVTQHLKKHYEDNDLKCQLCPFEGLDFAHMIYHRFEHQPADARFRYPCLLCPREQHTQLQLEFHFRAAHVGGAGGRCLHCPRTYASYRRYRIHQRFVRTGGTPCPLCPLRFPNKSGLRNHMDIHKGNKKLLCNVCGTSFIRQSSLRSHMQNTHTAREPVACAHCGKLYVSQERLDIHLKRLNRVKTHFCAVCSKGFASEKELGHHQIWHRDDRPHKCERCAKTFKSKSTLGEHVRKLHSNYYPHKCEVCDKAFQSPGQLKRHGCVHTGVRPAACPRAGCSRSFWHKAQLHDHLLNKHADD